MRNHAEEIRNGWRNFFLATVGVVALAVPIVTGVLTAPRLSAQSSAEAPASAGDRPAFEVTSIKLNRSADDGLRVGWSGGRFTAIAATTSRLIEFAYGIKDFQLAGGPSWINSNRYDVEAKTDDLLAEELQKLSGNQREEQRKLLVQSLLADRFKLVVSHETKDLPVYALVVANGGPKLTQAVTPPAPEASNPPGSPPRGVFYNGGEITGTDAPISFLADALSLPLGRLVLDKTGIKGNFDFTLKIRPEEAEAPGNQVADNASLTYFSVASIFTVIQEQLGLRLESTRGPVDTIVIDHVEEPPPN